MFNVAVITPSTGTCKFIYAQCLAKLVAYFVQHPVFDDGEPQCMATDGIMGSGISQNYELMVIKYLQDKRTHWTHFLSVEDDMIFSCDNLHKLARRKVPIVGANYSMNKGWPLQFASSKKRERCITTKRKKGLEEVNVLPQGFTLIERQVYEKMPHPWYMMAWNNKTNAYIIQDEFFCMKAHALGFKTYVDHDVSHTTLHCGDKGYSYEDALKDTLQCQKRSKRNGNGTEKIRRCG